MGKKLGLDLRWKIKEIVLICFLVGIDQISKMLTWSFIELDKSITVIPNFFYLTYRINRGAAFSFLADYRNGFSLLAVISLVAFLLFIYLLVKQTDKSLRLILVFLLAGTCGNGIDRWFYQGVVDMLDFRFGSFYYPVFNFADVFICLGAFLLFIYLLFSEKKRAN